MVPSVFGDISSCCPQICIVCCEPRNLMDGRGRRIILLKESPCVVLSFFCRSAMLQMQDSHDAIPRNQCRLQTCSEKTVTSSGLSVISRLCWSQSGDDDRTLTHIMAEEVLYVSPLLFLLLLMALYVSICLSALSIPVPLSSKVSEHPLVLTSCRDGEALSTTSS